jgi:hypothetical protein
MMMKPNIIVMDEGVLIEDTDCTVQLSDGSTNNTRTNAEGVIELNDKVPGIAVWIEYADKNGAARKIAAMQTEN